MRINNKYSLSSLCIGTFVFLCLCTLQADSPPDVSFIKDRNQAMLKAGLAVSKGDVTLAIQLYKQAIAGDGGKGKVAILARQRLLPLLFSQESTDLDQIEECLLILGKGQKQSDEELWNYAFRLMLRRVLTAEKDSQYSVWKVGLRTLPGEGMVLRRASLEEFAAFLISPNLGASLSPKEIGEDMLSLGLAEESRRKIRSRLSTQRLGEALERYALETETKSKMPEETRRMMMQAQTERTKGNVTEAVAIYSDVVKKHSENEEVGRISRRRLVGLLLETRADNLVEIDRYLSALLMKQKQSDEELWNYAFRLMLRRVLSADKDSQLSTWKAGLKTFVGEGIILRRASLEEFAAFLTSPNLGTSLSPKVICDDMLSLGLVEESRQKIRSRLNTQRLGEALGQYALETETKSKMPEETRRMMMQAQMERTKGNTQEAVAIYSDVVKKHSENEEVGRIVRRRLVGLLLELGSDNVDQIDRYLSSLLKKQKQPDEELWNWECRTLFRRILAVSEEERMAIWQHGISRLPSSRIHLSEKTLADLDLLVQELAESKNISPMKILTDMMLLVPAVESLRQLQTRRVGIFAREGNWKEAIAAQMFCILLATADSEGPCEEISQCIRIMEAANIQNVNENEFLRQMYMGPLSLTNQKESEVHDEYRIADRTLCEAAAQILEMDNAELQQLQKAYLYAWSGQTSQAVRESHKAFVETAAKGDDLIASLWEISVMLSIGEKRVYKAGTSIKLLQQKYDRGRKVVLSSEEPLLMILSECEDELINNPASHETSEKHIRTTYGKLSSRSRAEVLNQARARYEQHVFGWGCKALEANKTEMAAEFWAHVLQENEDIAEIRKILTTITGHAKNVVGISGTLKLMEILTPQLSRSEARSCVMINIARLHYETGNFQGCLTSIQSAEAEQERTGIIKDMSIGFIQAMSHIRLNDLDKAAQLLKEMENWTGDSEQHARALFLLGWIKLQKDDKAQALLMFRRVVDRYGKTRFAPKAKDMVEKLEGI